MFFWGCDSVLNTKQKDGLESFFNSVDSEPKAIAIRTIEIGFMIYKELKENQVKPLAVSIKLNKIKNSLSQLLNDFIDLDDECINHLKIAGQKIETRMDIDLIDRHTKFIDNRCDFFEYLEDFILLCESALKELPIIENDGRRRQGRPKGKPKHDRILASHIVRAYKIAFDRWPKRLVSDNSELAPIYKILGIYHPPGIIREVIENTIEIK